MISVTSYMITKQCKLYRRAYFLKSTTMVSTSFPRSPVSIIIIELYLTRFALVGFGVNDIDY